MKIYKIIIISLLIFTTIPFLMLYSHVDFDLARENREIFRRQFISITGNIFGFIGIILLMWQYIFGIRYIAKKFTSDIIWVNDIHKKIGKYGMLFVFIHPLLLMYAYIENLIWLAVPDLSDDFETHITYGRIAFMLLLLIWLTSALLKNKMKYRPWLYLHYLSYPIIAFAFIHALDIGTFLEQYNFLKAIWAFMIVLFGFLSVFRLLKFLGLDNPAYTLIDKQKFGKNIFVLTFKPIKDYLLPKPGQYVYVQLRPFGEAHPFTILEYKQNSGQLIFGIKALGKFTNKLSQLGINQKVRMDGPYGIFTREGQNNEPKVILAGGIGVTPFIGMVKSFGENTFFLNCNKNLRETIYREVLKELLRGNYYDFLSRSDERGKNIINDHINEGYIKEIIGKENLYKYSFFICGSKRFIDGMQTKLKNLQVDKKKIFYEKFF